MRPTEEAYEELQLAWDFYNIRLFEGRLIPCILTFQRAKRTYGYFSRERFINRDGKRADEIALNPEYFAVIPLLEILQTMVHEMCHQWQHQYGTPGRRRYHNKEWAEEMIRVGLMPTDTGKPGGKITGEHMSDYVIVGGEFSRVTEELLMSGFGITWLDRFPIRLVQSVVLDPGEETEIIEGNSPQVAPNALGAGLELMLAVPENRSHRLKYTCTFCKINVWGKPGLNLKCGDCDIIMVSE